MVSLIYGENAFGRRISGVRVEVLVMNGQPISHLHDDVFLLLRPEFDSFFLLYLNLVIQAVTVTTTTTTTTAAAAAVVVVVK